MKLGQMFLMFFAFVLMFSLVSAVSPSAGSVSEISSERAPAGTPDVDGAYAGNLTELNIVGYSLTQTWQGYYGNVSGTIQLANADSDVMYNWTLADPEGEVYASISDTISWGMIQCFNFTATGGSDTTGEEAGGTNQKGLNLELLEGAYGINSDDVDGVDETFSLDGTHESGQTYEHSEFYANNLHFAEGECLSSHMFTSSGSQDDASFEEVLLIDPTSNSVIFTALLDENEVGFDDNEHDFEMLVLEDGHGIDKDTTAYYFYVELE